MILLDTIATAPRWARMLIEAWLWFFMVRELGALAQWVLS